MSFYSQVNDYAAGIRHLVYVLAPPLDQQLDDHLSGLDAAVADDAAVWGPWGAQSCIDWQLGQSQGELGANVNYWAMCDEWEEGVRYQLQALQIFLSANGLTGEAAEAGWLVEQSTTASEQASGVVPDAVDIWQDTPDWIKLGGLAALALLLVRVLK